MNSLLDLQLQFSHTLLMKPNDIKSLLNQDCAGCVNTAVDIYKNAYQNRLFDTLRNDYPMLSWLLESEQFNALAAKYIEQHPSSSYSLRSYGEQLSAFLLTETRYKQQPYLAELAEFEWQLVDIFDQADTAVASIDDMSQFDVQQWPQLTIKLHTTARWLTMNWNLLEIYPTFRDDSKVHDLIRYDAPKQCLVWRQNNSPHFRLVEAREWFLLKVLENSNFSELCFTLAELEQNEENTALEAATYLKSWLSAGLIESVQIP